MAVDHPDMQIPQLDEASPPRSVHDSEDESIAGSENASTEGPQLLDGNSFSSHSFLYGPKSLIEAVRQSSDSQSGYDKIKAILENERVEVDERGAEGRTALSFAIEENKYRIVELLLKKGADPNSRDDQNRTPFFRADMRRRQNQPDFFDFEYRGMIKTLLRARADPGLTDDRGDTPLALAAATGDEVFVNEILSMASATEIGTNMNINLENKNADGYTALSLAAREGHDGVVKLLVEEGGAEINTQGNEETSPLMCAAAARSPKCMSYLLSRGADMDSYTWWERFLKTRSLQRKEKPDLFRCQKPDPLQRLPFQRQQSDLKELASRLHNRSFWNEVLPSGRTFLSWAVEYEDEEIVKLLLDLKADPDIRDTAEHQMTPLIKALRNGNMAMVDLLQEKDTYSMHILVGQADDMGEEQALELTRKLLGQRYILKKRDRTGQNPVHIACRKGRKHFVEEFLHPDYENDFIHHRDNSGKTPLQYATENEDIVKLLVKHGADPTDVPSATLFKLRDPNPHCVQLTRYQNEKMCLRLISDYDEAREPWNPRLFNRWSPIPEFRTPELEEDLAVSGDYCRFFQPKSPRQSGETKMFKLCIFLPDLKRPSKRFTLEIAWAIREIGSELAYGYLSTLSSTRVPRHHETLLKDLMTEVAGEWRQRASDLVDDINKIRLDQVKLQGRSRTVLESLQRKAEQHARLQSYLKGHIAGLTHVVDTDPYLRGKENFGDQKGSLKEIIRAMDQEVSSGLAPIEQNIRELLQIEIAWTSIREAKSIKRLTWITFVFLPLMFASSLFGMNINLLKDNPDWRWFLPIAASLILLTFGLWLLFDWAEPHLELSMKRLINHKENLKYTTADDGRKSLESSVV